MTKKQIMRVTVTVLICIAAALIIIFAVFGSVTASAEAGKMPVCRAGRGDKKVALTFTCAWDATDTDKGAKVYYEKGAHRFLIYYEVI